MTRTRCEVRMSDPANETQWSERGLETGEFFISPNPGEDLRPLARIASGGELSRIMLALKTLASTDAPGKTLIFDEVDAGIGGAVADVVGRRLQALVRARSRSCASRTCRRSRPTASSHFRSRRSVRRDRTITEVTRLDGPDREQEMARMIGGADISATVMASAREMLESEAEVSGAKRRSDSSTEGERPPKRRSEDPPRGGRKRK